MPRRNVIRFIVHAAALTLPPILQGCAGGSDSTATTTMTITMTTTTTTIPMVHMPPDHMSNEFRPPAQTAKQKQARAAIVADARKSSEATKGEVKAMLTAGSAVYKGTKLENMTADQLLEVFHWEFEHLPMLHGAPFDIEDKNIGDDDRLGCALGEGFLKNVCQRWVMRGGNGPNCYLCGKMEEMFRTPSMASWRYGTWTGYNKKTGGEDRFGHPTMVEANDCTLFNANNLGKSECGNFNYGTVNYVINTKKFGDMLAGIPGDSGWFGSPGAPFGTLQDFLHLVPQNVQNLQYDLPKLLKRWAVPGAPAVDLSHVHPEAPVPYMEWEWYGTFLMPEALNYIVAAYDNAASPPGMVGRKMWGSSLGEKMQQWMKRNNRPLVWANCDNSGMLLDPVVGVGSKHINQSDVDYFNKAWSSSMSWHEFRNGASKYLWFRYLSFFEKQACDDAQKDDNNIPIGLDGNGECVYFPYEPDDHFVYECLNDGTCGKVHATSAPGVTYASDNQCQRNCSQSKWSCVRTTIANEIGSVPGSSYTTNYCRPDPHGECSNREECEAKCTPVKSSAVEADVSQLVI